KQSKKHKVWLVGGTHPIMSGTSEKPFGRCYIYDDSGRRVEYYDKIHLFDVDVNDPHKQYRESDYTSAGEKVVTFDSPWGRVGVAVCYDIRFPEMFRKMSKQGVELIVFPAAFTQATGSVHWEVLLKARAIENLCYLVASAQGGIHQNKRATFGHSCVISPWGEELVSKSLGEGVVVSLIDLEEQKKIRTKFPALKHRKL
ncbi:MAG: carbon-nitrogen hydrolase family protein, partial [Kangiellaceae bacterium]|nr:carbon-nitrogen hydrolase family protein [Kangiellaceae bacterium]